MKIQTIECGIKEEFDYSVNSFISRISGSCDILNIQIGFVPGKYIATIIYDNPNQDIQPERKIVNNPKEPPRKNSIAADQIADRMLGRESINLDSVDIKDGRPDFLTFEEPGGST